jgi:PadR family transcriptional regulator, regulatory protein PadR
MPPRDLDLLQGTLDLLVLRALSFGPMHGYAVSRFIRQGSRDHLTIQDGALYTALHRLEARRLIDSRWGHSDKGKRAKFYELNTRGRQQLRAEAATWERYTVAVNDILKATPQVG